MTPADERGLDALRRIAGAASFPVDPRVLARAERLPAEIEAVGVDPDLSAEARARRRQGVREAALQDLAAFEADNLKAAVTEIDREEGAIRAALRLPSTSTAYADGEKRQAALVDALHRAERVALLTDLVREVGDGETPDEILDVAGEVAVYGDPHQTRRAWQAAVRRLTALHAAIDASDGPRRAPVFAALVQAQDALRRHVAAHPRPAAALRAIESRRAVVSASVQAFYGHARRALNLTEAAEHAARAEARQQARPHAGATR